MTDAKRYSRPQIVLHWATAVLIAAQFILHEPIAETWDRLQQGLPSVFDPLVAAHVAGGIAVLLLALWRLALRARSGVPEAAGSLAIKKAAHWGHVALYAVMIAMAVTGGAAWFGGVSLAAETHETLKPVLLVMVAGHVLAALWHQFVKRDGTLARMR